VREAHPPSDEVSLHNISLMAHKPLDLPHLYGLLRKDCLHLNNILCLGFRIKGLSHHHSLSFFAMVKVFLRSQTIAKIRPFWFPPFSFLSWPVSGDILYGFWNKRGELFFSRHKTFFMYSPVYLYSPCSFVIIRRP